MGYCNSGGTLESRHEDELDSLEAVTDHRELAVTAALEYCAEEEICPPQWVIQEASALLIKFLREQKSKNTGRTAGYIARYRQDHWDVERYYAVEEIRRIRSKFEDEIKLIREESKSLGRRFEKRLRELEKHLAWFQTHGTFESASMFLRGRDARASADTIKRSHREVKRRAGNGSTPNRYYTFDDRFLRKLDLPGINDLKPGNKFMRFWY